MGEYQLWASLAIELVGKAALARFIRALWPIRKAIFRCLLLRA